MPHASARLGPALHPDRGNVKEGYERKKKIQPLATGLLIGVSEEEQEMVAELRKVKYKAEVLKQIAENQRNNVGSKTWELRVDATGATDQQKEPPEQETQRNYSGNSQRDFNAPLKKCPGLGTGPPRDEALLYHSSESCHRAAGLDPRVYHPCYTPSYAPHHDYGTAAYAPHPHYETPADVPHPHYETPAYAPHPHYDPPAYAPHPHYWTPAYAPHPHYGTPADASNSHYGTLAYASHPHYGTPSDTSHPHYGTLAYAPHPHYGTPADASHSHYGTLAYAPHPHYGTLAYAPHPHYGTPADASHPHYGTLAYAPHPHYGTPADASHPHYGTLAYAPHPHYGTLVYAPHPHYDPLAYAPHPYYGTPAYATHPHYGTPSYAPHPHYGKPSYAPYPHYGTPSYAPHPHYGTPVCAPHPHYRTPADAPHPHYGTPAYAPHPHYGTPVCAPHPHYGIPADAPHPHYGTPASPVNAPHPHYGTPIYAPYPINQRSSPAIEVCHQSKASPLQCEELCARNSRQQKESGQSYWEALKQQIKVREKHKEIEKKEERNDAKIEVEKMAYDSWGRARGGAPKKDQQSNLHNDLKRMRKRNEERSLNSRVGAQIPFSRPPSDALCRETQPSGRPIDQRSSAAIEVSHQSKKSPLQYEELCAEKSRLPRESKQSHQEALRQQIKEREKQEEIEERQECDDAKIEAERMAYDPWGRARRGAPIKDQQSNLHSDLKRMRRRNEERSLNSTSPRARAQIPFSDPPSVDLKRMRRLNEEWSLSSTSPGVEAQIPFSHPPSDALCRDTQTSGRQIDQRSSAAIEVSHQSRKSPLQYVELCAEKSRLPRESKQSHQEALRQQIKEREKHEEIEKREKERYDAKIEAEMMAYDPWGRGGGGAPINDQRESEQSYREALRQQMEENSRKKAEESECKKREEEELEKKIAEERALLQKKYEEETKDERMMTFL